MDELIIKVLAGMATPAEEAQAARWRTESPENDAHFRVMEAIWAGTAPAPQEDVPPMPDAASLRTLANAEDGTGRGPAAAPVTSLASRRPSSLLGSRRVGWATALAAGIAAIALVAGPWGRGAHVASFEADDAGPRTITLQDGSVVKLAAGSRLEERSESETRTVALSGRAFFAVTHEADRPFVVRAAGSETRVVGTRFEVAEGDDGHVRVVVVEGRVTVSNRAGRVEVPAGSIARASEDEPPTAEASDDVFALLNWPEGLLVFQETPLAQVASEVGRYFQREVDVRGDALRSLRITALFEGQSFQQVVTALCDVSGAECRLTEAGATIDGVD